MNSVAQTLDMVLTSFLLFLPKVIVSLVIFVASLLAAHGVTRVARRAMEARDTNPEVTLLVCNLIRWSIVVFGTVIALQQVDLNLTAFLTGLGVLGFTVGFAVQDVSKNFVAGLLLLLQHPFRIGDGVKIGEYSGSVRNISLRATEIRTWDGVFVLIPNADVFSSAISNYSLDSRRRLDLAVGVAQDSDLELARATALAVVNGIEGVLSDPAPIVVYGSLGPSSVDFTVYFWIDTKQVGLLQAKDRAVVDINHAFEEAHIEMPRPTQTLYIHTQG